MMRTDGVEIVATLLLARNQPRNAVDGRVNHTGDGE